MYTLSFNIDTQTSVKIESRNRNFIDGFLEQLTTTERNVNNIKVIEPEIL